MLWPKIFILGWNKYGMEWLSHGLLSLQIGSSLRLAELHKLPSFRKWLFCGCNTTLLKIGFYLPVVMRSSLLLRFYMLAFLQSACLLLVWIAARSCVLTGQHFNSNLLSRPAWEYLRISESVWKYLKGSEVTWKQKRLSCACVVLAVVVESNWTNHPGHT